ncbi:MAG: hypothetical protein COU63_03825 [Candidatus Pacebacteria bacterium CG10_big_fil_rev_8_21_14_0_10_36_11]|nr:efflux RND transporter periplasmic adaptor subunit [Candidatus Pacearchaeota archaeon]OIP73847.1 MAG: hypothetical protein AUK08_04805 [Candidatus Pacebacteria bacterium CG2_30_36_39]PIR64590.1 MAG: hypothetical protein COU63_03825 [Candidatus Pacebacteria bacterium CG10_big_fil_rev_8_21_14_0_10_36_11]PJC42892.1 MAG: hypothetical protein CO040_02035 [Candidatus Pacebacteria bacterium CG_4_9_14_0_2_um_filter_36_8]
MKKIIKKLSNPLINLWKTKKWLVIGIVILLLIAGNNFYKQAKNKTVLSFVHPSIQTITKTLDVSGIIDAKEKANLHFAAGGKLIYLGAKEGSWVKKWQNIATIDQRAAVKTQEKSLNNYAKERLDWDQRQSDIGDGTTVDEELKRTIDKEQYDLNNSVLDVELSAISTTNNTMSAPFEGILVSSPTTVTGIQLSATDSFLLVNPKTLTFKALVDESDIALIAQNQTATLEFDAYPNEKLQSFVNYISFQSVPSSSGTAFIVELPVEASDLNKFRLGMNGDAKIELETKQNVLTIPVVAVKERDGKAYVEIKTGKNTAEEKEISVGLETDDYIEVIGGLTENDEIVVPE